MIAALILNLFLNASVATAQEQGTVPIGVTRLPDYPDEETNAKPDPVAAPVKPFGFESGSANGWYQGEGAAPAKPRKSTTSTASTDKEYGSATTAAPTPPAPYVEASNAGSSYSLSSGSSSTSASTSNQNRTIDCDRNGIVNCEQYGWTGGGAVRNQLNNANQIANDQFNKKMGR